MISSDIGREIEEVIGLGCESRHFGSIGVLSWYLAILWKVLLLRMPFISQRTRPDWHFVVHTLVNGRDVKLLVSSDQTLYASSATNLQAWRSKLDPRVA